MSVGKHPSLLHIFMITQAPAFFYPCLLSQAVFLSVCAEGCTHAAPPCSSMTRRSSHRAALHLAAAGRRMQEKTKPLLRASSRQGSRTRSTPPCQLDDAALVPSCCAPSRCGWSPYAGKATDSSTSKLVPESMAFPAHGSSGFHMIIQTIPPLLSLTIFCIVSWSFTWHSSPIMEILLVMPSLTSCSTVFPKMLVSQMPSSSFRASEI